MNSPSDKKYKYTLKDFPLFLKWMSIWLLWAVAVGIAAHIAGFMLASIGIK